MSKRTGQRGGGVSLPANSPLNYERGFQPHLSTQNPQAPMTPAMPQKPGMGVQVNPMRPSMMPQAPVKPGQGVQVDPLRPSMQQPQPDFLTVLRQGMPQWSNDPIDERMRQFREYITTRGWG